MLDRERVYEAFKMALVEMREQGSSAMTFRKIADHAREVYCRHLDPEDKKPSFSIFRAYLFGKRSREDIVRLVQETHILKTTRLERNGLLEVFQKAVSSADLQNKKLRPRTIAVIAHRFYCESLTPNEKPPSLVSFTRRVKGKSADPDIRALLRNAGIESEMRAQLDRDKLKQAFSECIRKFENRILRGIAKPIHVADSAHRIYVEGLDASQCKPSRFTFRRMIYGQDADPEIISLLKPHFAAKKKFTDPV